MNTKAERIDSNFGKYGNIEVFADEDANYSISMFISNQTFDSSIVISLRNLTRKEAKKLLKFDFDNPKNSIKMINYQINKSFF